MLSSLSGDNCILARFVVGNLKQTPDREESISLIFCFPTVRGLFYRYSLLLEEELYKLMERLSPRLPLMSAREGCEMNLSTIASHKFHCSLCRLDTRVCLAA